MDSSPRPLQRSNESWMLDVLAFPPPRFPHLRGRESVLRYWRNPDLAQVEFGRWRRANGNVLWKLSRWQQTISECFFERSAPEKFKSVTGKCNERPNEAHLPKEKASEL